MSEDDPMFESELVERLNVIANHRGNEERIVAPSLRLLLNEYEARKPIRKVTPSYFKRLFGIYE